MIYLVYAREYLSLLLLKCVLIVYALDFETFVTFRILSLSTPFKLCSEPSTTWKESLNLNKDAQYPGR